MPNPPTQPLSPPHGLPISPQAAHSPVSVARAAELLNEGRAVILSLEGAQVIVARADRPHAAIDAAAARASWRPGMFFLGTDPGVAIITGGSPSVGAVGQRLLKRLAPGPVIFVFPGPGEAGSIRAAMYTAHPVTSAVLARVDGPVAAAEVVDDRGEPILDPAEVGRTGVDAPVVEGSAPTGRARATVIEVLGEGREGWTPFRVLREGAYEERFIRKQLAVNILFVCTGNTCRSPMAEAIAASLIAAGQGGKGMAGVEVRAMSAGTAAGIGAPVSPEAVAAVRELGLVSALASHRSHPLTRRLIAEADLIFTMGRSHLAAVLELDPGAEAKARTLDPAGGDVPDPIGSTQDNYTATARRLMDLIRRRLKELGT